MKKQWLWGGLILVGLLWTQGYALEEGEDLLFSIHWGMMKGGYSTLTIPDVQKVNGQLAYHIVSEAHSTGVVDTFYHVQDRNEAWLEKDEKGSLRYEKHIKEGHYGIQEVVVLDQNEHRFHKYAYRTDKKIHEDQNGTIPPHVLDILGSLYYVRTLPLEVGKSFTIDVQSEDKVWPLVVQVKKREHIKVHAGQFDCFVVEPVLREPGIFISKGKKLEVWLTADARHMPVLMRTEVFIGHVSAELVQAHLPASKEMQLSRTYPSRETTFQTR